MAKASSRSYFPMRIDIPTLAGGVGRQSPAKRTSSEAENIDNFIVSVEHSAEKRRGQKFLDRTDYPAITGMLQEIYGTDSTAEKDLWFHWYSASADQKFLIVVDYSADPALNNVDMVWVYRIKSDGTFALDSAPDILSEDDIEMRKYLTWGNYKNPIDGVTQKAEGTLRAVAVGSSVLILNTKVKAGYESALVTETDEDNNVGTAWVKVGYDGVADQGNDDNAELQYETTVTVDPDNIAESWNGFSQYIAGDKAYDRSDPLTSGSDVFGIWKVADGVNSIVGPNDKGFEGLAPSQQLTIEEANRDASIEDTTGSTAIEIQIGSDFSFTEGDENNRATAEIKFYSGTGEATTGDDVAGINDWDDLLFKFPKYPTGDVYIRLKTEDPSGKVRLGAGTETSPHTIGYQNCLAFSEMSGAIKDGINKLSQKEGTDYVGVPWTDHILHCTAEQSGLKIILTWAYPASQWERDVKVGEDGEPVLDDNDTEQPRYTEYTLASDYYYPDPDKQYLGQAIQKLSDLKFPPTESSFSARNNANDAIKALYPDIGDINGFGKVYYLGQPYLGLSEGHYRVKDIEEQPYLHVLRTPDAMSEIDKKRMPKQLYFSDSKWNIRDVDWDMRTSGSIETNPGPSIFHDADGTAVQSYITAMSFYRDRLFFSSEDKLVSSRLGDWDNFWLFDPNNITVNDPLDLSVSSNSYTPITYLQPYRNFLFLATSGNVQYELLGSENQISPLTAEISPTSFFGMAENTEPVLMNNNLFFFDRQKLYIYFGEQSDTQQQAIELSVNAPYYLPKNYSTPTVSSDKSSIYIIDKDNPSNVYVYTNRVSGDQILQNSFYRFVLSPDTTIRNIKAYEDFIYIIAEETTGGKKIITASQLYVNNLELTEPRLDNMVHQTGSWNPVYNATTDMTEINAAIGSNDIDTLVISNGDNQGAVFNCTIKDSMIPVFSVASLNIPGDHTGYFGTTTSAYIGKSYTATVELSPQFWRDQEKAAVNGTLNLRYGLIRYRNSGGFNLEVSRQGRTAKVIPFEVSVADDREVTMDSTTYKSFGIFKAPILGFSEDLNLKIVSNNVHPLGISSLEFVGKFKFKNNSFGG